MQSDSWKVGIGIVIFLVFFTSPFWYNFVLGTSDAFGSEEFPNPEISSTAGETCIMSREEIRVEHMELLDIWRDEAIRDGHRARASEADHAGRFPNKSLSSTCLGCHDSLSNFCTRCHDYAGERPYCWDCHVDSSLNRPAEEGEQQSGDQNQEEGE